MLSHQILMLPTPSANEPGWKNRIPVDKNGKTPTHHNQRWYDKETGRVMQKGISQVLMINGQKAGLKLQPDFAGWMMGYPKGYLDLADGEMPPSKRTGTR